MSLLYRPLYAPHQARRLAALAEQPNLTLAAYEQQRAQILQTDPPPITVLDDAEGYRSDKVVDIILDMLEAEGESMTTKQIADRLGQAVRHVLRGYLHPLHASGLVIRQRRVGEGNSGSTYVWAPATPAEWRDSTPRTRHRQQSYVISYLEETIQARGDEIAEALGVSRSHVLRYLMPELETRGRVVRDSERTPAGRCRYVWRLADE